MGPHRSVVAIIFKKGLKYQGMKNRYNCEGKLGKLEVYAISIHINKVKTFLALCYRPPDKHMSEDSWTECLDQFAGNYLTVGDFNAHHPLWETKTCAVKEESCLIS
jgi:hypothetical protein